MDFGILLVLLLVAIDGVIGIHVLQMPIVACTLMGLVTGNVESAIAAGASAQVVNMMLRDTGFEAGFFSALVVLAGEDASSSMAMSVGAVILAIAVEYVIRLIMTAFLPMARNSAAKGDDKKIGLLNFAGLVVRCVIVAIAAFVFAGSAAELVTFVETNFLWVANGFIGMSFMLRFLGLAIVLRNLSLKDMPGAFAAGIATAMLFVSADAPYALFACALLAFAIGAYDYHNRTKNNDSSTAVKGGAEKWW